MTKKNTYLASWGTAIAAVSFAAVTFPAIGKTAEKQHLSAVAEAHYEAVANFDAEKTTTLWLEAQSSGFELAKAESELLTIDKTDILAESRCMAEAIYYEARSETTSGQRAVAEVIQNRIKSKHYPNSVCDVVYEGSERTTGCQFSFTCDGSMDIAPRGKSWERSVKVANYMLSGSHLPITNNATHYHTTEVSPAWSQTMRMTRKVGSHVFYRFAPRNYKPSEAMVLVAPPI
ncbi:MAG: cell wall hydrolase [Hellea sp.]|nr:cell wall hydrolase [Hellea sp.]